MNQETKILAQKRDIFGKKTKTLRKSGKLPAILYGHDVDNIPLTIDKNQFHKIFSEAGTSSLVSLTLDGKTKKVLIHEPQVDPISGEPIHIDFYQVRMTEKIKTEIPIKIIGESKAVKELEGNLITNKDTIEIECLPQDLISEIEIDISPLETFEDTILVKDLKVPQNIAVLNDPEEVVVLVTPPRSEEELAELEEEVEEEVEKVEAIKEKPEEGVEEEITAEGVKAETKEGVKAEAPSSEKPTQSTPQGPTPPTSEQSKDAQK